MRFELILLSALAVAANSNYENEIDCKKAKAIKCSTECDPICAGNDTRKETFINACIYETEYCNRGLGESNYQVIDSEHGCPINCDILRNCITTVDTVCVKNPSGSFSQSFTNECFFDNEYCRNYQETLGLDYCIYRQECS